jgi:hypothetical protein
MTEPIWFLLGFVLGTIIGFLIGALAARKIFRSNNMTLDREGHIIRMEENEND